MIATPTTELQEELQRKIGRNLLRFQQVERLMKFLVINAQVTITSAGHSPEYLEQVSFFRRRTMGQLLPEFLGRVLADAGTQEPEVSPINAAQVRITYRLELGGDEARIHEYQDQFTRMIEQRNKLVHHFLSEWPLDSAEAIRNAIEYLDRQREELIPLHDHLQSMVDGFVACIKNVGEFLDSEEGQRQFQLSLLQQSRIVALIFEAAPLLARTDGWTFLAAAGRSLARMVPEELALIKQRYGYQTLKQLLIASEFFDIFDEPINGGFRTLYRIKPEILAKMGKLQ